MTKEENHKIHCCMHLKELLDAEKIIINRHFEEHKKKYNIEDKNLVVADFISKFGWIMKEIYCESACPYKNNCEIFKDLTERNSNINKT